MTEIYITSVLFLSLITVARFIKLPLHIFYTIYSLVIVGLGMFLYLNNFDNVLPIIISGIVGIFGSILVMALVGPKLGVINYNIILVGLGLFPWYLDVRYSLVYVLLFMVFITIFSEFKKFYSFKKNNLRRVKFSAIGRVYSKDEQELIIKDASIFYYFPFVVAYILVFVLFLI